MNFDIELEQFPTERMLAVPFTNTLQRHIFWVFYTKTMNINYVIPEDNMYWYIQATVMDVVMAIPIPQECFGL